MGGPAWLTAIFVAASLAVAIYCAGRLVVARRGHRTTELDTDGAHVVMGVAMAGMLVSGLHTLPSAIWEVVFAAAALWFGYRMLQGRRGVQPSPWRSSHPLPHLVECAAMLFMFLILPAAAGAATSGMSITMTATESRFSFLTLPLALYLFGYVVWLGDRVTLHAPNPALAPATPPAVASAASGPGPGYGSGSGGPSPEPARPYLAPRCAAICKITMGITMGYM